MIQFLFILHKKYCCSHLLEYISLQIGTDHIKKVDILHRKSLLNFLQISSMATDFRKVDRYSRLFRSQECINGYFIWT